MDILTPVHWNFPGTPLGTQERFFLLGSCFSGEFARRLEDAGEKFWLNPMGTLYDPLSMARVVWILEREDWDPEDEIFLHRDLWRHPDFHTELAHPNRSVAAALLRKSWEIGREGWYGHTTAVFTFGTAFAHIRKETGRSWSNCHTLPGNLFFRKAEDPDTLVELWRPLLEGLKMRGIKVFFTLSPVRHLRNDATENSLSKALLRIFIHQMEQKGWGIYFPASEILLDELRDYRWYAEDMVHPSPQAADYITRRFWDQAAGPEVKKRAEAHNSLVKEFRHRPKHPGSAEDRARRESWEKRREVLIREYPGWNPPLPPPEPEGGPGNET